MTVLVKAKNRLRAVPKDYTFSEARQLLNHIGFKEYQKGKTSGSRVFFFVPVIIPRFYYTNHILVM